ncbi:hypothetical protein BDZ89DRAFT_1143453 [Hymenopellis radicata]|nr:hypothetical protein BDZ89DRAFT_1143453 [Hymenopellis radicata]
MFERLHIDFAKKGWRASNKRDEFPQMTQWVVRKENVHSFERYTVWVKKQLLFSSFVITQDCCYTFCSPPLSQVPVAIIRSSARTPIPTTIIPQSAPTPRSGYIQDVSLPKNPTVPNKPLARIAKQHHVPNFAAHLLQYMNAVGRDTRGVNAMEYPSLPFNGLDVYYCFKFGREGLTDDSEVRDVVKCSPLDGGCFDTVVVLTDDGAESAGLDGTRIGRIRVLFRIPAVMMMHGLPIPTPKHWPRSPLAVEGLRG